MVFTVVIGFLGLTAGSLFMLSYSLKKKPKKKKSTKDTNKVYI